MAKKRKIKKAAGSQPETAVNAPDPAPRTKKAAAKPAEPARPTELITEKVWTIAAGSIIALATFLRFYWLTLKVMHHDEGVNGHFLKPLFNDGIYKYDPSNYHGPSLYFISLAFTKVFGFNEWAVRSSVAVFGLLIVVLALYLKRYIGRTGSLVAALFLALSPGMVFISRYYIHEIIFVFLSMAIALSVLFFFDKRKAGPFATGWATLLLLVCFMPSTILLSSYLGGDNKVVVWSLRLVLFGIQSGLVYYLIKTLTSWSEGRYIYLILAAASAALLFGTKETAFITVGTMAIACGCLWIRQRIADAGILRSNWFTLLLVANGLLLVAAVIFRENLNDAYKFFYTAYLGDTRTPNGDPRPHEYFAFFSIVFLALTSLASWVMFMIDIKRSNDTTITEPVALTWATFREALGERKNIIIVAAVVAASFLYVFVLFFTSFFTYAEGVKKALEAYAIWTKTGNKDHTMHGWYGYLKWGVKLEAPILITSTLGILIAFIKGKHRFAMFAALWALGLFAAYSIIPYKTPWLALSFILPMCIVAGYGLNEMISSGNLRMRSAAIALVISATALLSYQTYLQSFVRWDDDDMPYVYAHTRRGFLDMVDRMEYYAQKSGKGRDAQIEIVTPDYWPLTWYVRDYTKALFQSRLVDASTAEIIIAKKNDQDAGVIEKYSAHYTLIGVYALRPGVDLTLMVRKDLEPEGLPLSRIPEFKAYY